MRKCQALLIHKHHRAKLTSKTQAFGCDARSGAKCTGTLTTANEPTLINLADVMKREGICQQEKTQDQALCALDDCSCRVVR
jgi:hypothetical protein